MAWNDTKALGDNLPHGEYNNLVTHVERVVVSKTANYTCNAQEIVLCNASGGAFTVTLPASPSSSDIVTVKKTDSSENAVTVNGNGDNIDGDASFTINSQYESYTMISDGTSWHNI